MTINEWRKLKPGDKVWVNPGYFVFPFLGVIKLKNGRKVVWVNLYGDAQFAWHNDDRNRMLKDLAVYHEGERATKAFEIARGRRCCGCKYAHEADDGKPWCSRLNHAIEDELDSCMYWIKRNFNKLSRLKHIKHE